MDSPTPNEAPPSPVADPTSADPATLAILSALQQRFPNTRFKEVSRTPIPGIWEVWMGPNAAYVSEDLRYFVFGHLYDMQSQTDLTAAKKGTQPQPQAAKSPEIKFSELPLGNAIKTVRGNGQRKLAVFADPECPYCQQLETSLARLNDVTIYTFLYPLESLHPEAAQIATSIWCSPNKAAAWQAFMLKGQRPRPLNCQSPVPANIQLAEKYGIRGTPFIVFSDNTSAPGALDLVALERRLSTH